MANTLDLPLPAISVFLFRLQKRLQQINWHREDGGAVVFGGYFA
jgi:hypothetical protein